MIGQDWIRSLLIEQESVGVLPHFIMLVGSVGSGRKTLIDNVFNIDNKYVRFGDCKVDTVRELIDLSYILHDMFFFIPDADNMSTGAQNALLKVVEECPNGNYYILSVENENNLLNTLHSRASVYFMDRYTKEDLLKYCAEIELDKQKTDIVITICENIGEINELLRIDIENFYEFVKKVVDNADLVSVANAMKIYETLKGCNLKFFFRAYLCILVNEIKSGERSVDCWRYCTVTSKSLQELDINGVNKQAVFDSWLFQIRDL